MDKSMTFTRKEIALALGLVDVSKITAKIGAAVKRGDIPTGLKEYTYEQVKAILRARKPGEPDPRKVDALKRQLMDDGLARK